MTHSKAKKERYKNKNRNISTIPIQKYPYVSLSVLGCHDSFLEKHNSIHTSTLLLLLLLFFGITSFELTCSSILCCQLHHPQSKYPFLSLCVLGCHDFFLENPTPYTHLNPFGGGGGGGCITSFLLHLFTHSLCIYIYR